MRHSNATLNGDTQVMSWCGMDDKHEHSDNGHGRRLDVSDCTSTYNVSADLKNTTRSLCATY